LGPRYHNNLQLISTQHHDAWPPQGGLVRYVIYPNFRGCDGNPNSAPIAIDFYSGTVTIAPQKGGP